jgi:hypothetical protein
MSSIKSRASERDVVAALRGMHKVEGVHACEYILAYDEEFDEILVNVALILLEDEWNDAAMLACETARTAAWEVLSPLGATPNLHCRTAKEHAELKVREPIWTAIDSSVNC